MSDKRGAMSNGHDGKAGLVETMMTADSLRLTACGSGTARDTSDRYPPV